MRPASALLFALTVAGCGRVGVGALTVADASSDGAADAGPEGDAGEDGGAIDATIVDGGAEDGGPFDGGGTDATTGPCAYTCTVDIPRSTSTCDRFPGGLTGGTYLAQIDMTGLTELEVTFTVCDPVEWVVHVADSPSCNGGGGDGAQFSNDAEVNLMGATSLALYGNEHGPIPAELLVDVAGYVAAAGCTTRTWTVRDQYFSGGTPETTVSAANALRLDPPMDTEGAPDAIWYFALNRVYASTTRSGSGAQTATFCLR